MSDRKTLLYVQAWLQKNQPNNPILKIINDALKK